MSEEYLLVGQHLLDYGANVLAVAKSGETPLFVSIQQSENASFLEMILKSRPLRDKETRTTAINSDCFGETPLFSAVAHTGRGGAYRGKIQLLLAHRADVNATDHRGISVLHVRYVHESVFQTFMYYNVNIDHQNMMGRTPLHQIAYAYVKLKSTGLPSELTRYENKVYDYLSHGARDEIEDVSGKTAEVVVWEGISSDCHVDTRMTDPLETPAFDGYNLYEHSRAWSDPILTLLCESRIDKEINVAFASITHPNSNRKGWSREFGGDIIRNILDERYRMLA